MPDICELLKNSMVRLSSLPTKQGRVIHLAFFNQDWVSNNTINQWREFLGIPNEANQDIDRKNHGDYILVTWKINRGD